MSQKEQRMKWKQLLNLGGVPGMLLLFYPVMMFLVSRRRDGAGAYATVDASAGVMILFSFAAFAIGGYYIFLRKKTSIGRRLLFSGPLVALLMYHIWAWCTSCWSVDFKLTFFRAFESISYMLLIVAAIQELKNNNVNERIFDWSMLYVTVSIVFQFLLRLRMGVGISPLATQYESTLFFFMAILYCKNYFQKCLTIILAILSMSTAGYAAMAVGSIFAIGGKRGNLMLYAMAFILLGIVLCFVDYKELLRATVFRNHPEIVEKWDFAKHSSGRGFIHEIAVKAFKERPVEGWGYVACEPYISRKVAWGAGLISFHSGYLSALVGTGVVGFVLFALFLSFLVLKAWSTRIPNVHKPFCRATLIVILAHTLCNPGLGARVTGSWVPAFYQVVIIVALTLPNNRNNNKQIQ